MRKIYSRYTNRIESFGMDENWLDLTGCVEEGQGKAAADKIRNTVKEELGLTVSVGVSFNKVFAKLGSDFKKPTEQRDRQGGFKENIGPLPFPSSCTWQSYGKAAWPIRQTHYRGLAQSTLNF